MCAHLIIYSPDRQVRAHQDMSLETVIHVRIALVIHSLDSCQFFTHPTRIEVAGDPYIWFRLGFIDMDRTFTNESKRNAW